MRTPPPLLLPLLVILSSAAAAAAASFASAAASFASAAASFAPPATRPTPPSIGRIDGPHRTPRPPSLPPRRLRPDPRAPPPGLPLLPPDASDAVGGSGIGGAVVGAFVGGSVLAESSAEEAAGGGWRQYVPLGVSVLVILDILLGSPAANLMLSPMRRATQAQSEVDLLDGESPPPGGGGIGGGGGLFSLGGAINPDLGREGARDTRERVDSESIARDALDRARGMVELNKYLEETKSDQKRFEEMRRKLDRQMEEFDSKGAGD